MAIGMVTAPERPPPTASGTSTPSRPDSVQEIREQLAASLQALRRVLLNPDLRRLEVAWTLSIAAQWALIVALLVYAYQRGGAAGVGILGLARTLPTLVGVPLASTLGDRYPRIRVLLGVYVMALATGDRGGGRPSPWKRPSSSSWSSRPATPWLPRRSARSRTRSCPGSPDRPRSSSPPTSSAAPAKGSASSSAPASAAPCSCSERQRSRPQERWGWHRRRSRSCGSAPPVQLPDMGSAGRDARPSAIDAEHSSPGSRHSGGCRRRSS